MYRYLLRLTFGQSQAAEDLTLNAFSDARPCKHKTRRPPSAASTSEAARLRGTGEHDPAARVVIDMDTYASAASRLNHATRSTLDEIDDTAQHSDGEEMA